MRLTRYFMPTLRETPSEAQVASHRLMLRAGMIDQTTAGIYSWLPMGLRVMRKIEAIVREEQDRIGAQEIIMPTIQPLDLWQESGRDDGIGQETLRMQDRHGRDMLYAPTAEEVVTDIGRHHLLSYRDLPTTLYQINWKFRDEIRPRFGIMRGREFLMKDAYSFDLNETAAAKTYEDMFRAYLRTFARLELTAVPVKADSGAIGGDLSHEFQILASTGESDLYYDATLDDLWRSGKTLEPKELMKVYTAADEMHDPNTCPVPKDQLRHAKGIEIGHIFYLGTKYSDKMKAKVMDQDGKPTTFHMGCYGIGVSRLVGAIIEASHDEAGIIWPESVAPFKVGIVNVRSGDAKCDEISETLYQKMMHANIECLYDDREERAGVKFADMDLIGLPWQVTVGPRGVENKTVEIKKRATGHTETISLESALAHLQNSFKQG